MHYLNIVVRGLEWWDRSPDTSPVSTDSEGTRVDWRTVAREYKARVPHNANRAAILTGYANAIRAILDRTPRS